MHENGLLFCFLLFCDLRDAGSHRACLSQAGTACTVYKSQIVKALLRSDNKEDHEINVLGYLVKSARWEFCAICWILLRETIRIMDCWSFHP